MESSQTRSTPHAAAQRGLPPDQARSRSQSPSPSSRERKTGSMVAALNKGADKQRSSAARHQTRAVELVPLSSGGTRAATAAPVQPTSSSPKPAAPARAGSKPDIRDDASSRVAMISGAMRKAGGSPSTPGSPGNLAPPPPGRGKASPETVR